MKRRKTIIIVAVALVFIAVAVYLLGVYLPEAKKRAETERLIREYYENKLALYKSENDTFEDYEVDVAFLGDSLTDGYDLEKYYPQFLVSNRGIGGETSHGLLNRLQISVIDLCPKVAVILIGGNNLDTMFESYEKILIEMSQNLPDTEVILCSLTSMGGSWGHKNKIAAYNNVIIEKLAEKYGYDFVDLYYPLFDSSTGEIYAEYTSDGAHLTHEGYRVFTATLTPAIEKALERWQSK